MKFIKRSFLKFRGVFCHGNVSLEALQIGHHTMVIYVEDLKTVPMYLKLAIRKNGNDVQASVQKRWESNKDLVFDEINF